MTDSELIIDNFAGGGGEWLAIIFIAWALWFLSGSVVKYITRDPKQDAESEDRQNE